MHLLDIIENSVRAEADKIVISICINEPENKLKIGISDNGKGMDKEMLKMVSDPFFTTKTEREKKVGLGIPLFKQNAELAGGGFFLTSKKGNGTKIDAEFQLDHIDRMPLGNLSETFLNSIIAHPEVDFFIKMERKLKDKKIEFIFSTEELKKELGDVPLSYPDVISFIKENLNDGEKKINMGESL